jgi:ribosomal protein S18 acetylase RimI-like enzyme
MNFIVKNKVTEKDKNDIFQGLLKYNLERLEDKNPKDLGVFVENDNNEKIAGIICDTHGKWLIIHYLWVDELQRGNNIGSKLLMKAEEEAKERGCQYSFVDTFDFQAPGFYTKHGYKEVFQLKKYPVKGVRFYYTKEL